MKSAYNHRLRLVAHPRQHGIKYFGDTCNFVVPQRELKFFDRITSCCSLADLFFLLSFILSATPASAMPKCILFGRQKRLFIAACLWRRELDPIHRNKSARSQTNYRATP